MSAEFRYWCGECGYRTPWLDEAEGAERLAEHYRRRHPGVVADGDFEIRRSGRSRGGCLGWVRRLFPFP
ncbi:hypothetical protein SacglDRAFT_01960 [Saccharomonospora glauca K62]|uniref:Uncharacterized protein n=1 Tax=Saccharomonospora glauca K62 TaxID=928724 RepID=I1D1P5_9PSEU|nr:hypothetical protein SacglDRAFT_01960 [Saccharomonospora glauca K62]